MLKIYLFYSQNNKIVWLSNMADTFLEKFIRCAKACGLYFLDCALRMLIGWTGKLRSRGSECLSIGNNAPKWLVRTKAHMKLRVIPVKWLPCKRGTKLNFVPEWNSYRYHVKHPLRYLIGNGHVRSTEQAERQRAFPAGNDMRLTSLGETSKNENENKNNVEGLKDQARPLPTVPQSETGGNRN